MLNRRNPAIAVITAASVSLSVMSVAQAQGSKKPTHRAIYNTTRDDPTVNRPTPPLDGTFHIELTWPEGSPDYHGTNGG